MAIERTEGLLTVENLKKRFLLGVDLTLEDGTPYPAEFFEYVIKSAISVLEHDLDIYITPTEKIEDVDFRAPNYTNWNYVQLDHYPILSVTKWEVVFPSNSTLFEYPNSWIKIDDDKGVLRLFPDQGSIPQWMVNSSFMPHLMIGYQNLPHFYKITYQAGFDDEGVPFIINEAIGLIASILPLDTAGDLLIGAGIATSSIGMDGLSQSIGTTSSATNSGYGSKIISYEKRLKSTMKILRDFYKGMIFDVA